MIPRVRGELLEPPLVSLTFDDGLASQLVAARLLEERGLRGTFYVSSGALGTRGALTWDDVLGLEARGHEVGGHSRSHALLPELPPDEARREIEDDRQALAGQGLDPVTFAYPYGASSPHVEELVRVAGYRGARAVGGIVETSPPEEPFRLRAPNSARAWTTAEHLAGLVLAAVHQRGWMILPFHHVSSRAPTDYMTRPRELETFLDTLVEWRARVLPVRELVGELKPVG